MAMPEEKRQEEAWYYCSDMLIKRAMNREEFLNFYQLRSGESTGEEKLEERKAIAEYLGLSIHQLKYRSEELQEAGLLKWKLKGKGRNRRWILVG